MAGLEYRVGTLTLRPGRELRNSATSIPIGARALELLTVLAHADGRVISKDELVEAVWPNRIIEDNTLQAQITLARKALGAESARLVTIFGRGYRLDLDQSASVASNREQTAIAVLAFEDLSRAQTHSYLGEGLAEELIHALSRVPGLKVPSRTSSFAYKGKAIDIRTIATELGVSAILEGTIRADSKRLRVGVHLIDAQSGFTIWSGNFDRAHRNLLCLQEDLAVAITTALRREFIPPVAATDQDEAMRLVLEARMAARSVRTSGLNSAIRLANEAITIDPNFGKAWEALAGAQFVMATWGFASGELIVDANANAKRAIELDSTLVDAKAILGGIAASHGNFKEASAHYDCAIALHPTNSSLVEHAILALHLPSGAISRSVELIERCIELAPRSSLARLIRASCAIAQGDAQSLRRNLNEGLRLGQAPSQWLVEYLQYQLALLDRNVDEAMHALTALFKRELGLPMAREELKIIVNAAVEGKDQAEAITRTLRLFGKAERNGTLWNHMGNLGLFIELAVRLDDIGVGFTMATKIVPYWRKTHRLMLATLTQFWTPHMASFRSDPRFDGLVEELNLKQFWQNLGPPDGHRMKEGQLLVI